MTAEKPTSLPASVRARLRNKADEIGLEAEALNAGVVIFNHQLSASQQRNLEQVFLKIIGYHESHIDADRIRRAA